MPCIEDWVSHPLNVIDGIRKESGASTSEHIHKFFAQRVQDGSHRIPSVNDTALHNLKPNSLVKFRCMVQDMFGPEYFLSEYETVSKVSGQSEMRLGMYRDMADCSGDYEVKLESARNVTAEKHSFYCVSIPGETEWAKEYFAEKSARHVRHRAPQSTTSNKRTLELDDQEMEEDHGNGTTSETMETIQQDEQGKKLKGEDEASQGNQTACPQDVSSSLNHPIPGEKGPSCIVHIYDKCDSIKLNDMIEFIGIVSIQPKFASFPEEKQGSDQMSENFMCEEELAAHYPPTSLVPRLHCISFQHLKHSNPSVPSDITEKSAESLLSQVVKIRDELLTMLQGVLYGDSLAAEYLLLHLVSSVYTRCGMMAVGKFALNITGCSSQPNRSVTELTENMVDTLKGILPKCVHLPMSLHNMNNLNFVPKKDYKANRLTSGVLQLSSNTELIVDETALESGQLNASGVQNVTALGSLISWQKIEYDFNFYKTDFLSNIQVLVLSEGKSMLPCDCQVKIEATSTQPAPKMSTSSKEVLDKIRRYLGLVQSCGYLVSHDMQKALQEDFVRTRQQNPSNMTADDFHMHLLVARLMAVSFGCGSLTQDVWDKVKHFESMRKARLPSSSHSSN